MDTHTLQHLTQNDWVLVNARAKRLIFKLGDEIIREGASGDVIYIIRRGSAAVEVAGAYSRAVIAQLGAGDICGEIAFLENGKATATIIAKEDEVEVDAIQTEDLRQLFDSFPGLGSRFYHSLAVVLAQRLRDTSRELLREKSTNKALK